MGQKGFERSYCATYLFLLHKLRIWHIIDDAPANDWGGQNGVYLLGIHVFELSVQDELVAFRPKVDGDFPTKKDEGENITMLRNQCQQLHARLFEGYVPWLGIEI